MKNSLLFILSKIRKGKRIDYPDYFITIKQLEGYDVTISRERNSSITLHYHDNGVLTFDPQGVDSFENVKMSDWNKLNLLKVAISVQGFSIEFPEELKDEIHDEMIYFSNLLRVCLGLEIGKVESSYSYQWFMDLLNSEKGQQFLRHHLATIRYFHGDFDPLQEFLMEDTSDNATEEDAFFEDEDDLDFEDEDTPNATEEDAFFEDEDDLNFEDEDTPT